MSGSDDQLPLDHRNQRFTSSDMPMVLVEQEVLVEMEDPDLEEDSVVALDSEVDPDSVEELKPFELHPLLMESTKESHRLLVFFPSMFDLSPFVASLLSNSNLIDLFLILMCKTSPNFNFKSLLLP
jgi:hypothetical protein